MERILTARIGPRGVIVISFVVVIVYAIIDAAIIGK